jgi:hypothetical protein
VPFEEDERDPKTWFLDLDYIESMWEMFRKVNGSCSFAILTSVWELINLYSMTYSERTPDRILSYRTSVAIAGFGDQREIKAIHAEASECGERIPGCVMG